MAMSEDTDKPQNTSKTKLVLSLLALVFVLSAVIVSVIVFVSHQADKNTPAKNGLTTDQACVRQQQENHNIIILNDVATPAHVLAHQCDLLTIINQDEEGRQVAFGLHENHTPYDGVAEKYLVKDQSITVTLIQTGSFRVHDHIHDEVQATFTVNPR
jgi:hypothetical protein